MSGEKMRVIGEYLLIVALVLGILEILLLGVAKAALAVPEETVQDAAEAAPARELEYAIVPLAAEEAPEERVEYPEERVEHPEATHNDLDELRGFDGVVEECTVTYYCCEKRPHICGGGTGKTATGTEVTAGRSAAVDPEVIPLGADIWVDFGDGVLEHYVAEDTGGAVNGAHIDLAVATHDEALELGVRTAKVWWTE